MRGINTRSVCLCCFVLLAACGLARSAEPVSFQFALYLPAAVNNPHEQLEKLCTAEFPHFKAVREAPKDVTQPLAMVALQPIEQYAPPDERSLKYFGRGLSPEQGKQLRQSKFVLAIDFATAKPCDTKTVELANRLMLRLAEQNGGFLWDEETREVFTKEFWKTNRLDTWQESIPDVNQHITIHFYRPNEDPLARAITLGMRKFGLPDVVINQMTSHGSQSAGALMHLVCQTMVETAPPPGKTYDIDVANLRHRAVRKRETDSFLDKATGKATLSIAEAKREEGDPHNRLLELTFENAAGDSVHARRGAVLDQVYGSKDTVVMVEHDKELLAASSRAKAKLPEKKKLFAGEIPDLERLLVKAPFKSEDGRGEWMWVEVTGWKGKQITGVLANDPEFVPNLKSGDIVTVNEDEIFDYVHYHADGTQDGNETTKILEKQQSR